MKRLVSSIKRIDFLLFPRGALKANFEALPVNSLSTLRCVTLWQVHFNLSELGYYNRSRAAPSFIVELNWKVSLGIRIFHPIN